MDENTVGQPAQRKDALRNRAALIASGAELFEAAGPMPTLDEVARKAGVGVGTAYRHFANKYVLAQAVLAESMEAMLVSAEKAAMIDDATAGLQAFFEAVFEPQAQKRALARHLRSAPSTESDPSDVRGRIERCIDVLLERGREQGVMRPDLTSTDVGVLMSAVSHLIEVFGDADPDLWRRLLPVLLDGLRADAPTPLTGEPLSVPEYLAQLSASRR